MPWNLNSIAHWVTCLYLALCPSSAKETTVVALKLNLASLQPRCQGLILTVTKLINKLVTGVKRSCKEFCLFLARQPPVGQVLLIHEVSRSHMTHQPVGLFRTSDHLVAETSTWQNTTLTTDRHPYARWHSNPQSQQANGRRPTP